MMNVSAAPSTTSTASADLLGLDTMPSPTAPAGGGDGLGGLLEDVFGGGSSAMNGNGLVSDGLSPGAEESYRK